MATKQEVQEKVLERCTPLPFVKKVYEISHWAIETAEPSPPKPRGYLFFVEDEYLDDASLENEQYKLMFQDFDHYEVVVFVYNYTASSEVKVMETLRGNGGRYSLIYERKE